MILNRNGSAASKAKWLDVVIPVKDAGESLVLQNVFIPAAQIKGFYLYLNNRQPTGSSNSGFSAAYASTLLDSSRYNILRFLSGAGIAIEDYNTQTFAYDDDAGVLTLYGFPYMTHQEEATLVVWW